MPPREIYWCSNMKNNDMQGSHFCRCHNISTVLWHLHNRYIIWSLLSSREQYIFASFELMNCLGVPVYDSLNTLSASIEQCLYFTFFLYKDDILLATKYLTPCISVCSAFNCFIAFKSYFFVFAYQLVHVKEAWLANELRPGLLTWFNCN